MGWFNCYTTIKKHGGPDKVPAKEKQRALNTNSKGNRVDAWRLAVKKWQDDTEPAIDEHLDASFEDSVNGGLDY